MKLLFSIIFFCFSSIIIAQENKFFSEDLSINKLIDGTLLTPNKATKQTPLAIIIPGSGPTNRNGNQNFLKNNSLKKLAEALSNEGIATFRYDKRIVKQIRQNNVDKEITFDDFITDANSVLEYFINEDKFGKIYVIGHSQGSLVGMIAAKGKANGFVSLAGPGKPIDEVLYEQISKTAPGFSEEVKKTLEIMKSGNTTDEYPPALVTIFNKDLQPFLINWMQYNPSEEIKNLTIPVLIINGTKDLQVTEEEAKLLKEASPDAQLVIIKDMNHVLVPIEGDDLENSKSYNESFRKLSPELINSIVSFIK
ncbi:alpha/beta hydrolase [Mangrovimonas aestuarii]|uniref:alpha/beta hydrolase n=1 Tax=Mangrovimonas aestuarii TaxID=3018443 RepID=UPI0023796D89|nr:alpha/beta fold hydrolase [Mangrovimonas aestuarii]